MQPVFRLRRTLVKALLLIIFSVAAARAQLDFHVYSGVEDLIEGGQMEKLTVVSGNLQFNIRPPRNWSRVLDEAGRKFIFTSPTGRSAITVQFTTNSPGALPEKDSLQAQALQEHPGAGIFNCAICPTSYRPGLCFDLTAIPIPHVIQKMRHAFVTTPTGDVEFVLTASEDEFDKNRQVLMGVLRAFRVEPAKPKD